MNKALLLQGGLLNEFLTAKLASKFGLMRFLDRIPSSWAAMAAIMSMAALILVIGAAWVIVRRNKAEQRLEKNVPKRTEIE